ncbi:MAG: hypothetical protein AAB968_01465, partial [Patescibacteria group bacterium]
KTPKPQNPLILNYAFERHEVTSHVITLFSIPKIMNTPPMQLSTFTINLPTVSVLFFLTSIVIGENS